MKVLSCAVKVALCSGNGVDVVASDECWSEGRETSSLEQPCEGGGDHGAFGRGVKCALPKEASSGVVVFDGI